MFIHIIYKEMLLFKKKGKKAITKLRMSIVWSHNIVDLIYLTPKVLLFFIFFKEIDFTFILLAIINPLKFTFLLDLERDFTEILILQHYLFYLIIRMSGN